MRILFHSAARLRPRRADLCILYTFCYFSCETLCILTIDILPEMWYNNNVKGGSRRQLPQEKSNDTEKGGEF